uniref:Monodehydroascorbate reductase n=1 Tax=Tanacetum cinerariifolium TaxID=118510 RepID=A0A699HS08_TANCI|nr:hypothetical protein [Tanacetum cinerariifolium]
MLFHIIVKDKRTMDMTIDQQVALDEALVPHASRLRIGKSNCYSSSSLNSFQDEQQEMYYQSEYFREMLHICPRIPDQPFDELPFEEEILAFLRNIVINKCLSGKSTGYDSLRLSQAQILWGMYHKKNVDFAYLLWEDFMYQVEHKDVKKSNEMYYPWFTKVIVNFFMTKDPSIPRRNKVNWHYVGDDQMFTMINLVSRRRNTQQFGAILPVELTNENIRNCAAYKEYYAIASGAEPPKTKASVRKTQSSSDTTMPPPDDDDQDDEDDDQSDLDNDGDDFVHLKFSTHDEEAKDEESFDLIVQTPSYVENSDDEGNDDASHGMNVGGDEEPDVEDDDNELYGDVNINLEGIDSLFESTPRVDVPVTTTLEPLLLTATNLPPPSIPIILQVQQASAPSPATAPSTSLQDLPNFAQAENEDFLNKLDENIQNIIKEQVKEKVKVQVSKILPKIKKTVNEQLEAEVLTRASNSSKTSYVVAADLSELELNKILIENMESNKSIHRSDQQKNLYKALVDAYECDKIILDTYGDTITLKWRQDDEDKDEEPSTRSDRGSKKRRAGKEPESTKEPMHITQDLEEPAHQEFETGAIDDQPIVEASRDPEWFQKKAKPPTPDRDWNKTFPATHGCIQPWKSELAKQADSRTSFNELVDTPVDFSAFLMNRLKVDTLTPELLVGPTYELMKGSCKSLVELEFFLEEVYKTTTDQLNWNNPERQESLIGGTNANNSMVLRSTWNMLEMSTPNVESSLSPNFKSSNGITTSIWIGSLKADQSHCRRTLAFNVSLRMFTKSIVIQQRVKDLQLGVKSYQKKLNLTKPDTYRSDLKRKEAYTAYSNPRGFIYYNKDKQNRLMRIDELHKFNDGTLNDVRIALYDRLKGIWMKYLPQTIWRRRDKKRATAMIQAIDKQLKTKRIMRSLEKFVGDGLYEGDFRMLQRTI